MNLKKQLSPEYLSQIKPLQLRSKLVLKGSMTGVHVSPFHGFSSEFSQFRLYSEGDDLRYFDWKSYAKSEKLLVKQFREETNTNVYLILDSSASMGYKENHVFSKWECASLLAGSLALQAYQQRDSVSLIHGASAPEQKVPPKNKAGQLKNIFQVLEGIEPRGVTDLKNLFQELGKHLKRESMVFIFTDLWHPPEEIVYGIKSILSRAKACRLIRIHTREEEQFFKDSNLEIKDLETGKVLKLNTTHMRERYLESLARHQHYIESECRKHKVPIISIRPDDPPYQSLRRILRTA